MKNRLVLIVNENNANLVMSIGNIPIITESVSYNNILDLKFFIKNFIIKNNIKNNEIKDILIVMDFTDLLQNIEKDSFAYIQIGRVKNATSFNAIKNFYGIDLNIFNLNIVDYDSKKNQKYILDFIENIFEIGINKIAINSSFSNFNKDREKDLINTIEKAYPSYFKICPSYMYNTSNYIIRRNMMFLDLVLFEYVDMIVNEILSLIEDLDLKCNVYFMKGNGTITNLDFGINFPCYTWQCIFASNIIGAGSIAGVKNSFVLTNECDSLCIGILQNKMPRNATHFNYLGDLAMPPFFPRKIYYNGTNTLNNLKTILDEHNIFSGQIPVISFIDPIEKYSIHPYKLINIEDHPSVIASGALNAPFQLEINNNLNNMNPDTINKTKEKMKIEIDEILKHNNINLVNARYDYSTTPVKYSIQSFGIMRLSVSGNII